VPAHSSLTSTCLADPGCTGMAWTWQPRARRPPGAAHPEDRRVVVVDELDKIELASTASCEALTALLGWDVAVVATVHQSPPSVNRCAQAPARNRDGSGQ
jgi:hypothetical protein